MAGIKYPRKLSDKQRKFLKRLINIGMDKIVPTSTPGDIREPYILDLTIDGFPDDELYEKGECWCNSYMDLHNWVNKILNDGVYGKDSWDDEKLNSLGIYYKRYRKEIQ